MATKTKKARYESQGSFSGWFDSDGKFPRPDEPVRLLQAIQEQQALINELAAQYSLPRTFPANPNYDNVSGPESAYRLFTDMAGLAQEQLRVALLDTKNNVMAVHVVYQGTIDTSNVRIAEVFREAIIKSAASIIIAHNHPSGDVTESIPDVNITKNIAEAGKLLGIELLDHLVIGHGGRYNSLKEGRKF